MTNVCVSPSKHDYTTSNVTESECTSVHHAGDSRQTISLKGPYTAIYKAHCHPSWEIQQKHGGDRRDYHSCRWYISTSRILKSFQMVTCKGCGKGFQRKIDFIIHRHAGMSSYSVADVIDNLQYVTVEICKWKFLCCEYIRSTEILSTPSLSLLSSANAFKISYIPSQTERQTEHT